MKSSVSKLKKMYQGSNGEFAVSFPFGITLFFVGAPFKLTQSIPATLFKVKCASEQPGFYDALVPCVDFGVPTDADMLKGVEAAIEAAFAGRPVFAGCAGGIGRTGTFLAVVLKVLHPLPKPVAKGAYKALVRDVYLSHAVETPKQGALIDGIDVEQLRKRVKWLWLKAVAKNLFSRPH